MINNMNNKNLWVEKYRPCNLDEINAQNIVINSLKNVIQTKNMPHLIFYGPPGCGKTSTILALSKELFGINNYLERIIELNASDERGINIIRDKVKTYAKQSIRHIDNAPPWKIIILDEADTITTDSQFALRRIMEQYSNITRFCIICNYHNKIIDPIISRCSLFKFKPIETNEIIKKLEYICKNEALECSIKILEKIVEISRGDLRKAINLLQKCCNIKDNKINEEILDELSGIIPSDKFNNLMDNILKKNVNNVNIIINKFFLEGYSIVNQIIYIHNYIINSKLTSEQKSKIIKVITEIDQNLINGCDEYIQFMKISYYIMVSI